ncbi:MAG: hypothetical protein II501_00985 [Clostridia bacterium]|nr:hypothetical protein [Clostridia bacterium]
MGLYSFLFENSEVSEFYDNSALNLSSEIWVSFLQELITWNEDDIYAVSFFVDYDIEDKYDVRIYFGYNTERQFSSESAGEEDSSAVRWNYNFWLQNETFCFGEDGITEGLIGVWFRQQRIKESEAIEFLTEQIIYAVREIHRCQSLKNRFGRELPIIIHTRHYYPEIAEINIQANGEYLDKEFIEYCLRAE